MKDRIQVKLMTAVNESQHELASIIVRVQITSAFEIVRCIRQLLAFLV